MVVQLQPQKRNGTSFEKKRGEKGWQEESRLAEENGSQERRKCRYIILPAQSVTTCLKLVSALTNFFALFVHFCGLSHLRIW